MFKNSRIYRAKKKTLYKRLERKQGWRIIKCVYPVVIAFKALNSIHGDTPNYAGFWFILVIGILLTPLVRRLTAYIYFDSIKLPQVSDDASQIYPPLHAKTLEAVTPIDARLAR
jgi:hypothetical protein